jgi:hypothetical protein
MYLTEIGWGGGNGDWIHVVQDRKKRSAFVNTAMNYLVA